MTPQELKESILWNAIQGNVTKQIETETTLDVIDGISLTEVSDEEAYFEIPSNWCWAKIGEIFDLVNGKAFKPADWSEQGIPIIRIQNLNDPDASYNYYSGEIEAKYMLHGGELLFSWSGTPGTSFGAFIWTGGKAVLNQHIFIVYPKIKLDYEYARYALNGELRVFIAKAHGGAGLKHITKKEFDSCLLPVPPLAEQKRIVAKIEELLPLIDRYEKAWAKLEDFNKRFPGDMQKAILQMAIQGKLVEQRPEEGTGEELYRQIQAEKQSLIKAGKIKKEKLLEDFTSEETELSIPDSWYFCKLSSISSKITDGEHKTPRRVPDFCGYYLLSARNIRDGYISLDDVDFVDREEFENISSRCNPQKGDLLISCSGSVGRSAVVIDDNNYVMVRSAAMISPVMIDSLYLMLTIQTEYVQEQIRNRTKQTAQANLFQDAIRNLVIPLPPLEEQKRIVAKLEELLPLCEKLKKT